MSLILDALNKADREHDNSDRVPDLKTQHASRSPMAAQQRWLVLLAALVVVLLVVVAILAFAWLRNSATVQEPATQVPVAANPAPAVRVETPLVESPQAPAQQPKPAPAANPEVEALYQAEQGVVQIVEPAVRAAASEAPPRQGAVDVALARALWQDSETKPLPEFTDAKVITPEPTAVEPELKTDPAADAAFEDTLAALDNTPFLHELPMNLQDSIPTLMYAKHDFAEGAVVINKQQFTVGDSIAQGLVVERIMADGTVLSFNGETFKLAALSSWVNY